MLKCTCDCLLQPLADAPGVGEDNINPEARANLLSLATFSWMSALMKKVSSETLPFVNPRNMYLGICIAT